MNRINYLVDDVKKGNVDSFSEIIEVYMPIIYRTCVLSIEAQEEVEDAAQDIVNRIWDKIFLFDKTKGIFTSWVLKLIHNHLVTMHRKNYNYAVACEKKQLVDLFTNKYSKLKTFSEDRLRSMMTDMQYEVLVYHSVYGFTLKDLAVIYDCKTYTITKLYHEARRIAIKFFGE